MRIVIADDEPKIRRGLHACIEGMRDDWRVVGAAEDGESALEIVEREAPDVLLLDMNMPRMDGLALLERVSSRFPDVRCIVISGHAEFQYAQNAVRCGALDYLLKPIQPEKVEEALLRAAERIGRERSRAEEDRYVVASLQELREKLAYDLALGLAGLDEAEAGRRAAKLELRLPRFFAVALRLRPGGGERGPETLRALKARAQAALAASTGGIAFADGPEGIAALAALSAEPREDDARIAETLALLASLGRDGDSIAAYAGRPCEAWTAASRSYAEATPPREEERPPSSGDDAAEYSLVVRGAIRYMREQYARNIKLSDIASSVYVHANYLSELFKKQTGENIVDYLTGIRIEEAKRLIVQNEYKIYMVADRVGFKEPRYFSQVFKKRTGLTPAEYRAKHGPD